MPREHLKSDAVPKYSRSNLATYLPKVYQISKKIFRGQEYKQNR